MSTTERRVLTPEPPSRPRPTSTSPRTSDLTTADHGTTAASNRWLMAAKAVSEKSNAPTKELLRRLSVTKKEIVSLYEKDIVDVSDEACKDLSNKEQASRIKANEKVKKRLNRELKLQAAIHKMAARVVIQYNITVDEALSLAETEIREEVELSRQKKLKEKGIKGSSGKGTSSPSLTLEEEIELYAHHLEDTEFMDYNNALIIATREVPFARAEKEKRKGGTNNVDSTDQLFATLFKRDSDKDSDSRNSNSSSDNNRQLGDDKLSAEYGKSPTYVEPPKEILEQEYGETRQRKAEQQDEYDKMDSSSFTLEDNKITEDIPHVSLTPLHEGPLSEDTPWQEQINAVAALLLLEEDMSQEEAVERAKKHVRNTQAERQDGDEKPQDETQQLTEAVEFSSVDSSHELASDAPIVKNKKFSLIVNKVIDSNKAKKQAFKALGKSAISNSFPIDVSSNHYKDVSADEDPMKKEVQKKQDVESSTVDPSHELPPDAPKVKNRKFSMVVNKVIDTNRAKKLAFKSLGKSAMSKTVPIGVLSIHAKEDADAEERSKEQMESPVLVKPSSAGAGADVQVFGRNEPAEQKENEDQMPHIRNRRFSAAVGKVISANKHAPKNPFLSRAKSNVGMTPLGSAVSLLSQTSSKPGGPVRTRTPVDQLYKSAIVSAHDSIHINSANRHQSEKKLSKIAAKTQAENAKVAQAEARSGSHRARGAVEKLNREKTMQDAMYHSEISLQTATRYVMNSASVVVDNLNLLSKHELAVQKLLQEAERIKRRNESTDENTRLLLCEEEEERLQMSETQKNAYYAEWYTIQAEMAALSEQNAADTNNQLRNELEESTYFHDLQARGVQESIAEEVQKAIVREKQREERTIARLNSLENTRSNMELAEDVPS